MSDGLKRTASLTAFFGSYVFLQYAILYMCNRAGSGFLSEAGSERVYYWLQIFVIAGFLCYAAANKHFGTEKAETFVRRNVLGGLVAWSALLIFTGSSPAYLIISFATLLFLGYLGGAVYFRMACALRSGAEASLSMGSGFALAVALQYLTQIGLQLPVLLMIFILAALGYLYHCFSAGECPEPDNVGLKTGSGNNASCRRLIFTVLIAMSLLMFPSFYNSYIHHLQVLSGYSVYNVYTWPRLMWIPGYLLFGFIGSRKGRRIMPLAVLCVSLLALLNAVLTARSDAYWLNMCLFYASLSGVVSYYNLCFWQQAFDNGHPALAAGLGRILDSLVVILQGVFGIGRLSGANVLVLDIAALAIAIVLMALNGDLDLRMRESAAAAAPVSIEDNLVHISEDFGLTPREAEVLKALVSSEKDQQEIASDLSISTRTLQAHITSLYRKTGARNRSGLTRMVMEDRG